MQSDRKTVIVTGASQGIGAAIVQAFLARGYNVVGTARNATKSKELSPSDDLALIDGDIGQLETAQKVAELAINKFGSIDAVVANAGIFVVKPFTDYTTDDFDALISTNLAGFIHITQLAVKQMQAQKTGGSVVAITAALADNPIAGVTASLAMITKGGLETVTRHLAMEYAKQHIRFNAVAPVLSIPRFTLTIRKNFSQRSRRWRPSQQWRTLPARSFILPKRIKSQGKCCTSTAVRTLGNGNR